MKLRFVYFAGAAALLLALWLLRGSTFSELDLHAAKALAHWRSPLLISVFFFITQLGRAPIALTWSLIAWRRSSAMGLRTALAAGGGWLASEAVKMIVQRPRPDEILPLTSASGYGFPSGHASVAAATYLTLAMLLSEKSDSSAYRTIIMAAAVIVVVLVALSRVYLGVHYLTDVVAGTLLGAGIAVLLRTSFRSTQPQQ